MKDDVQPEPVQPSPLLFTPFTMRGLTARNRIVVSPMSPVSYTHLTLPTIYSV